MTYDLIDEEEVTEPVTLAELKSYLQIDADYSSDDGVLNNALTTARKRLESYLNVGLVNRDVVVQWDGCEIKLPLFPNGEVTEVTKNDDTDPLDADKYTVTRGRSKSIFINGLFDNPLNYSFFYPFGGQGVEIWETSETSSGVPDLYSVSYSTGYADLPIDLKQALMAEASYLFNLRGEPITDIISKNAALIAGNHSKNLIL